MTCDAWDVVAVPFPFTDKAVQKKRPALVVSARSFNERGYSLMAMITSSSFPWPGDSAVKDFAAAGLSVACAVRLKFFTLDNRLILRRLGHLSSSDQEHVITHLKAILPF